MINLSFLIGEVILPSFSDECHKEKYAIAPVKKFPIAPTEKKG